MNLLRRHFLCARCDELGRNLQRKRRHGGGRSQEWGWWGDMYCISFTRSTAKDSSRDYADACRPPKKFIQCVHGLLLPIKCANKYEPPKHDALFCYEGLWVQNCQTDERDLPIYMCYVIFRSTGSCPLFFTLESVRFLCNAKQDATMKQSSDL